MDKIDPNKYESCYHRLNALCTVTWYPCNPHHPDCEYEDESKLGLDESLDYNENP